MLKKVMFSWGYDMKAQVRRLLSRWGTEVCWGENRVQAMLHTTGSKSWRSMESQIMPLGKIADGQYVYIGPASPCPCVGDILQVGRETYDVRRMEKIQLGNKTLYAWGLCVKKGGD